MIEELPIIISENAQKAILEIIEEKKLPNFYKVRIGMKGANCGASFVIGFDKIEADDLVFDQKGYQVIISKKHLMYLVNYTVDFEAGEMGQGFTFINPKDIAQF